MRKIQILIKKPVYLIVSTLYMCKAVMYELWYD